LGAYCNYCFKLLCSVPVLEISARTKSLALSSNAFRQWAQWAVEP
jgi:hypothetical protein